jgi:hypothetical protein
MKFFRTAPKALKAMFVAAIALGYSPSSAKIIKVIQGYEVTYPKGKIGGSSETGLPAQYVSIPPAPEYYLDYQVMFESDWEWVKGGKLPGLVGGSHTSGCKSITADGWSARFMWRGGGRGEVYLYHQNRQNGCGDDYEFPSPGNFIKGPWNRITEHVVINTPGKNDGYVEAWYNGKKQVTMNNLQLRGKVSETTALVDAVSLQTFYGGSSSGWAPPHDTHSKFSNLYVRDDLPDLNQPFDAQETAVRQGARRSLLSALRTQGGYALSYLGNGNVTLGAEGISGRLDIFDAGGRLVRSLAAEGPTAWDGVGADGNPVRAGILFVKLAAAGARR